jgi:CAAX prenyl protease-like protein
VKKYLIAPYVLWMVLMAVLPATAWAYAVRGVATAILLSFTLPSLKLPWCGFKGALYGLLVGVGVFFVWVAPEMFLGLSSAAQTERATPSPYDPAVCTWALTIAKIAASAFVISIAEELFFRVWLVDFAGFWWMVALFAVEHGERWHVGALAGIAYGLIAKRFGIYSAIIAHATTNLILGLWVVCCDRWEFW